MLTELSIRNLAVIEHVHIRFKAGFHVLTGETGAGKSIIIDALTLIVGGRGSSELVRYGADKAEIEAMFELTCLLIRFGIRLQNLGIECRCSVSICLFVEKLPLRVKAPAALMVNWSI